MDIKAALGVLLTILHADPNMVRQMAMHIKAKNRFQILAAITIVTIVFSIPYYHIQNTGFFSFLLFGVLISLLYTWREYFKIKDKCTEEHFIIYLKATKDRNRVLPIAQIIDRNRQKEELKKNINLDEINKMLTVICIAVLLGSYMFPLVDSSNKPLRTAEVNNNSRISASQPSTPSPAYIIENGQVTLYTWSGEVAGGKLIIPSHIDGYPVTSIGKLAFAGRSDFSSVEIPEGVVLINSGAFKDCRQLQQIILPQSLQELGAEVFQNCGSLLQCTIPNGVKEIRSHAFDSCTSLKQVFLPESLNKIGEYAFSGCSALEKVQMPQSMPDGKISQYAFTNCKNLTYILIPEGVDKISARAFYQCSKLSHVELPMSLKTISSSAFRSCESLKSITIPKACVVDNNAFKNSPTSIHRK